MTKNWCLNGTMVDAADYSSPVPFIGLYTAAATLVCLVLIICDIFAGFRSRKLWLPCRYFSLNSVTLSLISIAAKLPVDLTTPMPSAQDQLSKLTGTVFICMFMAFLMPSLGITGEFESYANLLALSIFVVTVVVNICIQIATGVIFSFVIEHAIIMFSMLVLLATMWIFAYYIHGHKGVTIDRNRDLLTKGSEGSMLQRLKICYLHGYCSCPQLGLQRTPHFGTASLISTICLVVLAQAVIGSLAFKGIQFCEGCSDYGWSMWIVVITQIFTIVVCNFAISCRWLTLAGDMNWIKTKRKLRPHRHPHLSYLRTTYPFYMRNLPKCLDLGLRYIYYFTVLPINKLVEKLVGVVSQILGLLVHNAKLRSKLNDNNKSIEENKLLLQKHHVKVRGWLLKKSVEDMEKWMEQARRISPHHVRNLPSTSSVSSEPNTVSEVSCLSVIILVKMAKVSLPNSLGVSTMEDVLSEVFEVIHFVDTKINVGSFKNKISSMSAEVLWKGKTTYGVTKEKKVQKISDGVVQFSSELDRALEVIRSFDRSFSVDVVRDEVSSIARIIQRRTYTSLDELSGEFKILFAEMLCLLLRQLPVAIFNHVAESPVEEYEERVRLGIKFICEMELLNSYIQWSFPVGSNLSSLMDTVNCSPVETFVSSEIEDVATMQSFLEDDNV
ncbi:hypothetical protein ACHQM5_027684 [Ranunculus cassubicifolius]